MRDGGWKKEEKEGEKGGREGKKRGREKRERKEGEKRGREKRERKEGEKNTHAHTRTHTLYLSFSLSLTHAPCDIVIVASPRARATNGAGSRSPHSRTLPPRTLSLPSLASSFVRCCVVIVTSRSRASSRSLALPPALIPLALVPLPLVPACLTSRLPPLLLLGRPAVCLYFFFVWMGVGFSMSLCLGCRV